MEKFDELRALLVRLTELQKQLDQLMGVTSANAGGNPTEGGKPPSRPSTPGTLLKKEVNSNLADIPEVAEPEAAPAGGGAPIRSVSPSTSDQVS